MTPNEIRGQLSQQEAPVEIAAQLAELNEKFERIVTLIEEVKKEEDAR